jgi:hypothetical protein
MLIFVLLGSEENSMVHTMDLGFSANAFTKPKRYDVSDESPAKQQNQDPNVFRQQKIANGNGVNSGRPTSFLPSPMGALSAATPNNASAAAPVNNRMSMINAQPPAAVNMGFKAKALYGCKY